MKSNILAIILAGGLLLTGCENDFDPNLYGTLNPENYPYTESEYTGYMMTCYLPFTTVWTYDMGSAGLQHGWFIPAGGVIRMFDNTTDIAGANNISGWQYLSRADFTKSVYYWRGTVDDANSPNHFPKTAQITRYTEIIGTLEAAPEERLSAEKRNSLLGEARLCRGLMMYYLLHQYGPVRVVLDPTKVSDSETLKNATRPTLDEMCGWIYDDFEFAANNAPETAPDKGRFTADFGRFCLMRHCLNEGSHINGYYQKALDMYDKLKGKYSLFTSGRNPYADQFKLANKFNCEVIAAISCDDSADGNPKHGNMNPFLWLALPTDMVKEDPFPMGGGWSQFFSLNVNFYDTFEDKDLRKETIVTSYKCKDGQTIEKNQIGSRWWGYIINKWPQEGTATFQGHDIPLARWADVLLMYAETQARLKNSVTTEAVNAVNEVRKRAGLSGLSSSATSNVEAFLDAILLERGHELFYEGCRKIDLIRFNKFAQKVYQGKGCMPTHQYMPVPNYAVEQSAQAGVTLEQTYSRDGWEQDLSKANPNQI